MKVIQTYCCNVCYTERSQRAEENKSTIKRIEILESEKQKIVCTFCLNSGFVNYANCKIETEVPTE